ncbi:MAG TPA: DNA recombination protein RmuC [Candidatus Dormibacteraeota bacterium]
MSGFELLFALLLVVVVAAVGGVALLVLALTRHSDLQARELSDLRAHLLMGGQNQESNVAEIRQQLTATQAAFEGIRSALAARERVDDEARQSLRKLEAVIAGSSTRGAAGENILEESLRHLPPEMVARNHHVRGKVVEFAIRMPGGKVMPLDSKWTSSAALAELASPDSAAERRTQLAQLAEKEVEKRVREVAQYIDPSTTTPWALASVPDAAYSVCREAFAEAHRRHVIIVGYSMTMPYLLALYQLHLQFARTIDLDNLQASLMDIEGQLKILDEAFENRIQRAISMLNNAYNDGKIVTARIRASVHGIQSAEKLAESPVEPLPALQLLGD